MENNTFRYTYSAKEQQEVQDIRKKYAPQEESGLERLRRLDAVVYQKATARALSCGIVGALVMGTGMSLCMVWGGSLLIPGIAVGLVGIALVCLAYPLYNRVLKKERERIAPEILRLSDELMQ